MMPDDFQERLRAAMRRESDELPFVVTAADVERRLGQPSRRFPRWLALAALPLGTALVTAVLLANPRPPLVATSTPTQAPASGGVAAPASCPITKRPDPPFVPPTGLPALGPGRPFWYGTDDLWTVVRDDGLWGGVRNATGGYENKSFWWSAAFKVDREPQPALQVTGRRLDGPAETAHSSGATNAAASDIGSAMLTGVELPTAGCWELTGRYRGHELSYVVWIPGYGPTPAPTPRLVPAPPTCPITKRPDPAFVPPTGFPPTPRARYAGMFWYGTDDLWTLVNESGAWNQLPNGGDTSVVARDSSGPYEDKSFWWSAAFNVGEDATPPLRVTGRRLDGPAAAALSSGATNAIADLGPSMLTGLTVPASGCWELNGSYRGHELSYVVWIPGPND